MQVGGNAGTICFAVFWEGEVLSLRVSGGEAGVLARGKGCG
jgi:hypothetical protein